MLGGVDGENSSVQAGGTSDNWATFPYMVVINRLFVVFFPLSDGEETS